MLLKVALIFSLCVNLSFGIGCGTQSPKYPASVTVKDGKLTGIFQGPGLPQVFISSKHGYKWNECGATILNEKWIVTAAHCVDNRGSTDMTDQAWLDEQKGAIKFIIAGMHNMKTIDTGATAEQQRCEPSKLIVHPKWPGSKVTVKGTPMDNDIALIKLECTLKWTDTVRPACLPKPSDEFYTKGEKVALTGWGQQGGGAGQPDNLQQVIVDVEGESKYHKDGHVMDVAKAPHGVCKGDSGGSAMALRDGKWTLAGVTSYVAAGSDLKYCDSKDSESGFTHVPHYVDWIKQHISDMS